MCAMEYVVLFITKLISYTNCTNALSFSMDFHLPVLIEKEFAEMRNLVAKFSYC